MRFRYRPRARRAPRAAGPADQRILAPPHRDAPADRHSRGPGGLAGGARAGCRDRRRGRPSPWSSRRSSPATPSAAPSRSRTSTASTRSATSDIRLLTTLASSLSVALENARLFDETRRLLAETDRRAAELAIINSVQRGLAAKLDIQAMYELVGERASDVFDAQVVDIAIFDFAAGTMSFPYSVERGVRVRRRAGSPGRRLPEAGDGDRRADPRDARPGGARGRGRPGGGDVGHRAGQVGRSSRRSPSGTR